MGTTPQTPEIKPFWAVENRDNTLGGFNAELPGALYNDRDPSFNLKSERPVHRRISELALQGFNHKEIAALVNLHPSYVSQVLRQPHARVHMIEAAAKPVAAQLIDFLDKELMPSLELLRSVRDDPTAKASDRISAAKELADRRLGRAVQPFANRDKPVSEMTQAELDAEVQAALKSQPN